MANGLRSLLRASAFFRELSPIAVISAPIAVISATDAVISATMFVRSFEVTLLFRVNAHAFTDMLTDCSAYSLTSLAYSLTVST